MKQSTMLAILLKNNQPSGTDEILGELYEYGGE